MGLELYGNYPVCRSTPAKFTYPIIHMIANFLFRLQLSERQVDGVSILERVPFVENGIPENEAVIASCDGAFKLEAEPLDRLVDAPEPSSGNGSSGKKKKRRRNKSSNKKKCPDTEVEVEVERKAAEEADVYREMYRIDETLEQFRKPLQLPEPSAAEKQLRDLQEQQMYLVCEHLVKNQQLPVSKCPQAELLSKPSQLLEDNLEQASSLASSLLTAIPAELSSATALALQPDGLFDREFKFKTVGQQETKVVTWDELEFLVSEVFPHDSELKKAFETKSQNSFELWKFVVKYGKIYKDFVSEVLEMVNELKKVGALATAI